MLDWLISNRVLIMYWAFIAVKHSGESTGETPHPLLPGTHYIRCSEEDSSCHFEVLMPGGWLDGLLLTERTFGLQSCEAVNCFTAPRVQESWSGYRLQYLSQSSPDTAQYQPLRVNSRVHIPWLDEQQPGRNGKKTKKTKKTGKREEDCQECPSCMCMHANIRVFRLFWTTWLRL